MTQQLKNGPIQILLFYTIAIRLHESMFSPLSNDTPYLFLSLTHLLAPSDYPHILQAFTSAPARTMFICINCAYNEVGSYGVKANHLVDNGKLFDSLFINLLQRSKIEGHNNCCADYKIRFKVNNYRKAMTNSVIHDCS